MRFFVWVDFRYEMIALFLGGVFLILVYLAWTSYPKNRAVGQTVKAGEESGYEVDAGNKHMPAPPFLILIIVGIASWAVSFFIYMWATRGR